MPGKGKPPRRAASDTTRLKREIAQRDSTTRAMSRAMARTDNAAVQRALQTEQRRIHAEANAKQDTLTMLRKGAPMPSAGHKSFAKNTEGFDGAALGERPPRVEIPRGDPTPDALPTAHGRPALVQQASGLDNLRTTTTTKQAGDSRPTSSSGRGPGLPQHFNDSAV